jgi:NAD(P)-dependent dehydrogenase (short-subunit alcohol dehydrogenase family)
MYCGSNPNAILAGLDSYQYVDNNQSMNRIALITGATRNLGFSLAQGLAQRLDPADIVYLTGRDTGRVAESVRRVSGARADVRGDALDVVDRAAVERFADLLAKRHGGVDIVFSNHYTRVQPDDDPRAVIDTYVEANNLGTTHILRNFAPCSATAGGCSWSQVAPVACGRSRRRCTRALRIWSRSTMSTARSGATRCALAGRRGRRGRPGSTQS